MVAKTLSGTQRGFGLVEVMVAAAILSLGLGSVALLLLLAVQGTVAPRSATLAALHARSMVEAMHLLPDAEPAGEASAGGAPDCSAGATCSPNAMILSVVESWQRQIGKDIPTGRGLVCRNSSPFDDAVPGCDDTGVLAVRVEWRDSARDDGPDLRRQFVLGLPPR